jgi:hypothetical protein
MPNDYGESQQSDHSHDEAQIGRTEPGGDYRKSDQQGNHRDHKKKGLISYFGDRL